MDQKDEVKSKVDITEVISSYIPLKKAGRNLSGLCPFHTEKTPSFMVSPERQTFKCFGCGESGDAFTFLEKMEGWDFRETLEELAKRVGVKLKKFTPGSESLKKDKLIEIHTLVAKLYSHLLNKHPAGEKARKYLKNRGIDEETWNKFGLGYSPAGWENTFDFLKKRNFNISDVANSGLVIARSNVTQGSFYDRFRDRIVFPLRDIKGTVLGFSARVIESDAGNRISDTRKEPKYINSPETPIFNKGSMLFGIDVAKNAIRDKSEAVLVEGEFDVLSSFTVGVENVVASKGTALTEKQIALLARFSESVVLCFDSDIAGDAAARRAIEMMDAVGMIVKVANLGKYKDPDEFIKQDSRGFKNAIGGASNIYDFLIDSVASRHDVSSPAGKKKIGAEILPILSKISDDMMRAHYIQKLARTLDLDISLIASAVSKKSEKIEILEEDVKGENIAEKVSQEDYFLALVVLHGELSPKIMGLLKVEDFEESDAKSLFKFLRAIMEASKRPKNPVNITKVLGKVPKALGKFVDNLYLIDLGIDLEDKELRVREIVKVATRISEKSLRRKLDGVSQDLKIAEKEGNTKKLEVLTKTFDQLLQKLGEVQHNLQVS